MLAYVGLQEKPEQPKDGSAESFCGVSGYGGLESIPSPPVPKAFYRTARCPATHRGTSLIIKNTHLGPYMDYA